MHDVYFDESGDLGWILDAPYRDGGSSRYFTIAYVLIPSEKSILLDRFIRRFYKSYSIEAKREFKGMNFNDEFAVIAAKRIVKFLKTNEDVKIGAITVKKEEVPKIIDARNSNILYNYMVAVALTPVLKTLKSVRIIPDKRSVPTGSQNSCPDLLKTKLWLENNANVKITYSPEDSHHNKRLMFIDWVANFVWRNFEDGRGEAYFRMKNSCIEFSWV
ncbi:MAG: DUF3800 domain-containing protein [Saprospiraceae bacterium]|nr:DUF3800 domain-containing protein [Saprospiraceae bacterium]MCB9322968.1 DUF3800 domain-containing protein [Lewinellaceae bacterium]